MNAKQVLILILSLVGLTVLVIVGFMVIYSTNPAFLGMSPSNGKQGKEMQTISQPPLKPSTKVFISEDDFRELLRGKLLAENTIANNQRLLDNHNYIVDSLARIIRKKDATNSDLLKLQDTLKVYQNYLNASHKEASELRDSIINIYKKYPGIKNEGSKSSLAQNEPSDSVKMENIKQFANIYKNSNPSKVAKIIGKMDNRTAAEILKLLPSKQAGKIIDELPEDKAMSILLLK